MASEELTKLRKMSRLNTPDIILFTISTFLCLLVLGITAWIHTIHRARAHLRRVSFRLMVLALCFQIGYNCFRAGMVVDSPAVKDLVNHPAACTAVTTLFFQCLSTINWLVTCIAVNLALITCFGVNPIQSGLEKYYIAGSLVLGLGIPLIPAIQGHFGPDPLYRFCYITIEDRRQRIRIVIAEIVIWNVLTCIIASLSIGAAIFKLVYQSRTTKRIMRMNMQHHLQPGTNSQGTALQADPFAAAATLGFAPLSPQPLLNGQLPNAAQLGAGNAGAHGGTSSKQDRWWRRSKAQPGLGEDQGEEYGHLHDKVAGIALRISLYPIALIIINIVRAVGDIYFNYTFDNDSPNKGWAVLYVIYRMFNAGRGIVLALLCLFCDPCLKRGMEAAWEARGRKCGKTSDPLPPPQLNLPAPSGGHSRSRADKHLSVTSFRGFMNAGLFGGPSPTRSSMTTARSRQSIASRMTEPRHTADEPPAKSLDITDAIPRLPAELTTPALSRTDSLELVEIQTEQAQSPPHLLRDKRPSNISLEPPTAELSYRHSNASPTRSFAGVARASLPSLMTDDVDVDLRLTYTPARARFTFRPPSNSTTTSPEQHWDMSSDVAPSRRESRAAPPPITVEDLDLDLDLSDVLSLGPGSSFAGPSSVRTSPITPRMPTPARIASSPLRPTILLRPPEVSNTDVSAPPNIRSLTSPRVSRFPNLSPVIDSDRTMPQTPRVTIAPVTRYGESDEGIMLHPIQGNHGSSLSSTRMPGTPMSYEPPRSAAAQRFLHVHARESRRPVSMPVTPAALLRPSLADHERAGSNESLAPSIDIPTAPLPSRLLARRKQRASRMALAETRAAEENEEAMRRLAELESQL